MKGAIRDAVVLLAGAGSRLTNTHATPKPLVAVLGTPLIAYVLRALESVGVKNIHAVVGAHGDTVIRGVKACLPASLSLNRIENRQWKLRNGVSVLCAREAIDQPFFLTMGDHLFDPVILRVLVERSGRDGLNLAVDRKVDRVFDLDDAMKVATSGEQIVAISKTLHSFDAIDTGLFLCAPQIFDYLESAKVNGDCSLAEGVQLMANDGKARAIDIGDAWWQDVDTPAMLERAEATLPMSLRAMANPAPVCG
ncbi:MAG: NTP transferase domain-containing protein [Chthoniobacterales bacterium]